MLQIFNPCDLPWLRVLQVVRLDRQGRYLTDLRRNTQVESVLKSRLTLSPKTTCMKMPAVVDRSAMKGLTRAESRSVLACFDVIAGNACG